MRLLFAAPVLLVGCAATPADPDWRRGQTAVADAAAFRVPSSLRSGFDALVPAQVVSRGDALLYGLRLERDATCREWFLQVQAAGIEQAPWKYRDGKQHLRGRVRAQLFDAASVELGAEELQVECEYLERGLAGACRGEGVQEEQAVPFSGSEAWPESFRAAVALGQFLALIRKSPLLQSLLWQVVDPPSVFSVLGHLGAEVTQRHFFAEAHSGPVVQLGDASAPTWSVPVELYVNGTAALRSHVVVTDPSAPLALGAGIVAVTACHPTKPNRTFTMRLLAAHMGRS